MHFFKKLLILLIITTTIFYCASSVPINERPMYYEVFDYEKTDEHRSKRKSADDFLKKNVILENGSSEKGSEVLTKSGWDYYFIGDFRNAIKRFNQAWLLDSKNGQVYWGMVLCLVNLPKLDQKYLPFEREKYITYLFELAYKFEPSNARIISDLAFNYGLSASRKLITQKKEAEELLDQSLSLFKKSTKIDSTTNEIYIQWSQVLYYKRNFEEALNKLDKAEILGADTNKIYPFREYLKNEIKARMD